MKKSTLIFCTVLASCSLMAFGFMNGNDFLFAQENLSNSQTEVSDIRGSSPDTDQTDVELFYDVGSRYMTITKEDLDKVRSMADFLSREQIESIKSYHSVSITILEDNYTALTSETGQSDVFNAAQIKLLRTAPYSTNILIRAEYQEKNRETGKLENSYTTPHLTIAPEKEAEVIGGKDALIAYVKENSKAYTSNIKEDDLQPGKISFTVTTEGAIGRVSLLSTTGYPTLDKKMLELLANMPQKWKPAANAKGEKVDQELVFFFGIRGC